MMEILIFILIYILGCIVVTCLSAIFDAYFGCSPKIPTWCSFFSWLTLISFIIVILLILMDTGYENLYEWVYNKFKKKE